MKKKHFILCITQCTSRLITRGRDSFCLSQGFLMLGWWLFRCWYIVHILQSPVMFGISCLSPPPTPLPKPWVSGESTSTVPGAW